MTYSARVVANAIIEKQYSEKQRFTFSSKARFSHLRLQKLTFFVYAWELAINDRRIITETPSAWPYGPIFRSIYHELKYFGNDKIESYFKDMDIPTCKFKVFMPPDSDQKFYDLLEMVWGRYKKLKNGQLSTLTAIPGGPWDQTRQLKLHTVPDDLIKSYYKSVLDGSVKLG